MRNSALTCHSLRNALGLLGVSLLAGTAAAQGLGANILHESQMLQPATLQEGSDFGIDITLAGDWLFIGEPGRSSDYGGVKNFRLSEGNWEANPWNFDPDARNAFSLARFGQSLSVDEQEDGSFYLTIGQARSFSALFGSSAARATSYFYDGANWIWEPELPTAMGPASGHQAENFANSLAVSGTGQAPTLLVGAPLRPGADFLTLTNDALQEHGLGGGSSTKPLGLAIEGDRAAIGYGSTVIVLERAEGATEFVETLTLEAPEGTRRFGASLALQGDQLLVGAPDTNLPDAARAGQAFLFDLASPEVPTHTFQMADPISDERLGWAVAFGGDFVVVSAPGGDSLIEAVQREGRIATFDPKTGDLLHQLIAETPSLDDYFGYAIAAKGDTVMAGAPTRDNTGAVFAFAIPAPEATSMVLQVAALLTLSGLRGRVWPRLQSGRRVHLANTISNGSHGDESLRRLLPKGNTIV